MNSSRERKAKRFVTTGLLRWVTYVEAVEETMFVVGADDVGLALLFLYLLFLLLSVD